MRLQGTSAAAVSREKEISPVGALQGQRPRFGYKPPLRAIATLCQRPSRNAPCGWPDFRRRLRPRSHGFQCRHRQSVRLPGTDGNVPHGQYLPAERHSESTHLPHRVATAVAGTMWFLYNTMELAGSAYLLKGACGVPCVQIGMGCLLRSESSAPAAVSLPLPSHKPPGLFGFFLAHPVFAPTFGSSATPAD